MDKLDKNIKSAIPQNTDEDEDYDDDFEDEYHKILS